MTPAEMLAEFHAALGEPFGSPGPAGNELRAKLHLEETDELCAALHDGSSVGIAHELADVVYVAYGTAHALGIPLDAVLDEVHAANMSKRGPDGRFELRGDGKVLKGPHYRRPDVAAVLGRHGR